MSLLGDMLAQDGFTFHHKKYMEDMMYDKDSDKVYKSEYQNRPSLDPGVPGKPPQPSRRRLIEEGMGLLEELACMVEERASRIQGTLFGEAVEKDEREDEAKTGFIGRVEVNGQRMKKILERTNKVLESILKELE